MDARVQESVVASLRARPRAVEVGPFVIGWDPDTSKTFVNYATPHPDAGIGPADVTALVEAFRAIDRVPRLEYVTSRAPDLEPLLVAAGFSVEERHEYLVCAPADLVPVPLPDGLRLGEPVTDRDRADLVATQRTAFGDGSAVTPADLARTRRTQDAGGVVLMARAADGTCAGAGLASPVALGLSEVAGIAVPQRFRRRGIGAALTAAVTAGAYAAGAELAWLEASGQSAGRVYERIGYVPGGHRLYISLAG